MKNIALIFILMIMIIASAVGVVNAQYKSRKLFSELQGLEREQDDLVIEFGQLQLEQSTWDAHGRIENIARDQLRMKIPIYDSIQYIELVR